MKEKIIETLNKRVVDLYLHGLRYGHETNTPLIEEIAVELSATFDDRLRKELIWYEEWTHVTPNHEFAVQSVDEYLKTK